MKQTATVAIAALAVVLAGAVSRRAEPACMIVIPARLSAGPNFPRRTV